MKNKIKIFFKIIFIIFLWLISRKINIVPSYIWDFLYAIMIYFFVKLFYDTSIKKLIIISLIICFAIEFSQLINNDFFNQIRSYKLWKLVLWQTFLISDLITYFLWIIFIWILEYRTTKELKDLIF